MTFVRPGHPKREEWIKVIQRDRSEDTWLPTKYSTVCSVHFKADDIYKTKCGKVFLKKSAIPRNTSIEDSDRNSQSSPTSLEKIQISDSQKVSTAKAILSKKIINLKQQNKCIIKKKETLKSIVKKLKNKFGLSINIENHILKKTETVEMYFNTFQKLNKSKKTFKYSPNIRKFALTCNYYSPAAYKYVRHYFQNRYFTSSSDSQQMV
ncbi:hypothetical protein ACJJTC_001638 [Scirpophaga incertulas]